MTTLCIDLRMWNASGIGTYIRNLVPRIVAERPNWSFALLGPPDRLSTEPAFQRKGVTLIPFDTPVYSPRSQWQLLRRIPRDTELFWSPHYTVPVGYRGKTLVTVHDIFHVAMARGPRDFPKKIYAQWFLRSIARRAAKVLTVSAFSKAEMLKWTPIPEHKIEVIHLGVDPYWSAADAPADRAADPYFLFVGNVKPHKNLSILIEAMARPDAPPHKLVVVGKKEGFITGDPQTIERAEAILGERIEFTGEVTNEKLRRLYTGAEALVLPSLYEGFGLPPLEAMACGCPAIVSDRASLPEVCGAAALYCDPLSAADIALRMRELTGDRGLRASLVERGFAQSARFRWPDTLRKTLGVIESCVTVRK